MEDAHRYASIRTLVFDQENQSQIAWIDGAVWPSVGSIIELGNPNRDAQVLEVRLQLGQTESDHQAIILVTVQLYTPGEFVERKSVYELAADLLDPKGGDA